ncbi:hypothetical protein O9993_01255 [Vibrio lentus]|nr:hypothetical protein [Vibrio lentus]
MQQVMLQNPLGSEHDKLWLAAVEMMGYYAPDGEWIGSRASKT